MPSKPTATALRGAARVAVDDFDDLGIGEFGARRRQARDELGTDVRARGRRTVDSRRPARRRFGMVTGAGHAHDAEVPELRDDLPAALVREIDDALPAASAASPCSARDRALARDVTPVAAG